MSETTETPSSDPPVRREIDKTPGKFIFAALVCFFGGMFLAVFSYFLGIIFQSDRPLGLALLMPPLMIATHFLIIATIVYRLTHPKYLDVSERQENQK